MINFADFKVLSFDCYGTLIDWETGLVNSLLPVFNNHQIPIDKEALLELFGELEAIEEGGNYLTYQDILRNVLRNLGARSEFIPTPAELDTFAGSVKDWQPFPDTCAALRTLKKRFRLAIISNVDDDLFAGSAKHLQIPFDWVITAQQVESYKPSLNNFQRAIDIIGLPNSKILHLAQSLYHDIAPAKSLGLKTIWINRRFGKKGFGATPFSEAQPDLTFPNLQSFAQAALQ